MSVSAGVADVAIAVREKLRGKIGQTKVQRYWPGKKPEWAPDEDADEEKPQEVQKEEEQPLKDDPRLRRLAESQRNREEAIARHREIRQAEIVSTREEEKAAPEVVAQEDGEDEDALDERRRKNRERILQKQKEEEMAMAAAHEEDEDEEEEDEEDEYETDSDEETGGIAMVKPIFVKKTERDTIAERERLEAEENALHEAMKKKLEERRLESKHLVVEEIKKEEEMEKNKTIDANLADVDTDDETNEAEEYEAWKAREIARIKRERDEKEAVIKEKEEIEKLRNMTEEERKEWERKNPKEVNVPKKKWKFLQKYYHKGAFFQSGTDDSVMPGGDVVLKRDYSAPTGEDRLDKTILPKVMQVKHFGRSGRTKWTHLVAEDTTQWDSPWTYNDPLRAKYNTKMAGMNRPIQKPQGSKKLKRSWDAV